MSTCAFRNIYIEQRNIINIIHALMGMTHYRCTIFGLHWFVSSFNYTLKLKKKQNSDQITGNEIEEIVHCIKIPKFLSYIISDNQALAMLIKMNHVLDFVQGFRLAGKLNQDKSVFCGVLGLKGIYRVIRCQLGGS